MTDILYTIFTGSWIWSPLVVGAATAVGVWNLLFGEDA